MWHPFKIGMRADRVLELEKRKGLYRCARNKIVGWDGRLQLHWYFEACTLLIKFDGEKGDYCVTEILAPLDTGKRMRAKKAALTMDEASRQLEAFR